MAVVEPSALRERRRECGLTQAELAARAGVSRQLVAAVETRHNTPAVDAALRLARVLATTVEQLFGETRVDVLAALGGALPDGRPLRVGRVAGRLVATELADHGTAGTGWAKPDGLLEAGKLRLFPGAVPAGIVVAGCDPALGIAEAMLDGHGPRSLLAISAPTGTALRALQGGRVHAAVVHGRAGALPEAPVPALRWHLARWQVGLAIAAKAGGDSLESVLGRNLRVVQRDPAAASQQAFERAVASVGLDRPPAGPSASGHIDAARIAAAIDGAAVTTEAAARAFNLRFFALEDHTVEIWLAHQWLEHPGTDALAELLASAAFTQRLAHLAGYDLAGCGMRISLTAAASRRADLPAEGPK